MTNKEYKVKLLRELGIYCFCKHCLGRYPKDRSWKKFRKKQYK